VDHVDPVGSRVFRVFGTGETRRRLGQIAKGEFMKGPGPFIKGTRGEWSRFGENPERFSQGVVFQHFGTQEVEGPRTVCSRNHEIVNFEILKSGPWSRVDFGIPGPGSLKDQKSLQPESRNPESRKAGSTLSLGPFRRFRYRELEGQGA
jgi:hypothetical protein